jgi:transcriptional regulator GlxA family with amidase domain
MGGIELVPDAPSDKLGQPDLIFLPAVQAGERGTMTKAVQRLARQWGDVLREHYGRNGHIAANCSSTFVLAEAGLLDGRKATTSWFLSRLFRERYPHVEIVLDMLVTNDERILCSAAYTACLNLGLEIVGQCLGPRAVLPCARVMLIDVNRTVQLPYANLQGQVQHGDELVLRAQTMLLTNLARPVDVEKLAERLHVTSRTLGRRFKKAIGETPLSFLQSARVERAKATCMNK